IRIVENGRETGGVSGVEFARMTQDALGAMETTAFDFDPPGEARSGQALVTGRHTYRIAAAAGEGEPASQTVTISYRLELRGGRWRIIEAGSSSAPPAAGGGR